MGFWLRLCTAVLCLAIWLPTAGRAAEALDDAQMADVSGSGLTFTWSDFRFMMKPTSYIEQVGSGNSVPCTGTGNSAGNSSCWQRGDLRWYGVNVSGTGAGNVATDPATSWTESGGLMTACASQGINGLGCPRGGFITNFAAFDNPYILRAYSYAGDGSAPTAIGNGIVDYQGDTSASQTVLELLAPTAQDYYRMSFWGEIEVGKGTTLSGGNCITGVNCGLLKSQTIVQGNAAGSILRLFQYTQTNNHTLALYYQSHLQGDFRFSVNQSGTGNDAIGTPVDFDPDEGMFFRNVKAFVPLGQLFYQALTVDVPRDASNNPVQDGNFVLELGLTPDVQAVYTRFYSLNAGDTGSTSNNNFGYDTARQAYLAKVPGATVATAVNPNYDLTHGYSRWGDWYPCRGVGCPAPASTPNSAANALAGIGRNAFNSTGDGIFFQKCSTCSNFNAYAYAMTAADVRAYSLRTNNGGLGYSTFSTYAGYAACTPGASAPSLYQCGYGGAYSASSISGTQSMVDPSKWVTNCYTTGQGGACGAGNSGIPTATSNLNAINTSVANLGDSRIEGLLINHIKFTSFGAQY
jgi:hypothetical protein